MSMSRKDALGVAVFALRTFQEPSASSDEDIARMDEQADEVCDILNAMQEDPNLQVHDAFLSFAELWSRGGPVGQLAGEMTCSEVDALADVFRALCMDDEADYWITAHAASDDAGDKHHPDYNPSDEVRCVSCHAPTYVGAPTHCRTPEAHNA